MTPSQIETYARQRLNSVGSKLWSSEEIIQQYLYVAATELAEESLCIENRYTTTSVVDQAEYSRPTRSIAVYQIVYDGLKLKPISERMYNIVNYDTTTVPTGTPSYYMVFDDSIKLYPTPNDTKTIEIYSYDMPDEITASSSLEIPKLFHKDLVIGVAYHMSLKELGHPHMPMLKAEWDRRIEKAKRNWERLKYRDTTLRVLNEEELPSSELGVY